MSSSRVPPSNAHIDSERIEIVCNSYGGRGCERGDDSNLERLLISPRLIEALTIIGAKHASGSPATIKDLMYWLGVNDSKVSKIVSRLKKLGLITEEKGAYMPTDRGVLALRYIMSVLGIESLNIFTIDRALNTIRSRHVFYKTRTVTRAPHHVFDLEVEPSPKVRVFLELWRRISTFQRISAAVFMAMDFERVEDQIKDLRKRAIQAELSGIHRYTRLFSLALPPNLLGQEIPLKELAEDIGYRWRYAEVFIDREKLSRYVAQVDALRLARYIPEHDALGPLHETGLKAFRWLAERVDTAFRNIVDFYQPIAVSLYAIIYNNLITYDELIEGTRPRELEEVRDAVGSSTYREVVSRALERRLVRYKLVWSIGSDRILLPVSIFHRAIAWKGIDLNTVISNVKRLLESAPLSIRSLLEFIVRKVSVEPRDLVVELNISEDVAYEVLNQLSRCGFVIPARRRYLWIGVAPARLIEEAMGRDVFIILYDVTKRYGDRLARYGIDIVEVLEDLASGRKLDVASYVSSKRELIELDHYLFRLALMGLIKFEEGYAIVADDNARRVLQMITVVMKLPHALDTIGGTLVTSSISNNMKKLHNKLLEIIIEEKMVE